MKKKIIYIFCMIFAVFSMCCITGYCNGDIKEAAAQIMEIAQTKDGDITVTDVRKHAGNVAQEYSKDEITDILIMINDYYNERFGDADYYKGICANISASEVDDVMDAIQDGVTPKPAINIKLIIGIAGGVIVVGIIAAVLIVLLRKSNSGKPSKRPVRQDKDYPEEPKIKENPIPEPPHGEEPADSNGWDDYF